MLHRANIFFILITLSTFETYECLSANNDDGFRPIFPAKYSSAWTPARDFSDITGSFVLDRRDNAPNVQYYAGVPVRRSDPPANSQDAFVGVKKKSSQYADLNETRKLSSRDDVIDSYNAISDNQETSSRSIASEVTDVISLLQDAMEIEEDLDRFESRGGKIGKKYKRYLLPLLLAYKLKFFALIPLMMGGLVLLAGSTGFAGFFFALFAATMGLKSGHN